MTDVIGATGETLHIHLIICSSDRARIWYDGNTSISWCYPDASHLYAVLSPIYSSTLVDWLRSSLNIIKLRLNERLRLWLCVCVFNNKVVAFVHSLLFAMHRHVSLSLNFSLSCPSFLDCPRFLAPAVPGNNLHLYICLCQPIEKRVSWWIH